jgi:hypothetical protein
MRLGWRPVPRRNRALTTLVVVCLALGICFAAQAAAREPVLGAHAFAGRFGKGWGKFKPRTIDNGGVPSGLVSNIHWRGWGKRIARGRGRTSIYKPSGGYYRGLVPIQLRASNLGHCSDGGPLAYRHLSVRVPRKPGGRFGRWFAWSGARTLCKSPFR